MPLNNPSLVQAFLHGLIQALMQQKQALACRDLPQLEACQQTLMGLWQQLQQADKAQLAQFTTECHTIKQLVTDSHGLLTSEHQRVTAMLNLYHQGTYLVTGQVSDQRDDASSSGHLAVVCVA